MRGRGFDELASSALSSRRSDEHVTVESIVALGRRVKTEPALATLAYDDACHLIVGSIDCVSFRHRESVRRQGRRPLAVCWLDVEVDAVLVAKINNTGRRPMPTGNGTRGPHNRKGRRKAVSWLAPFESCLTKTLRGTLAFDDAAQASCRNHRDHAHMSAIPPP
jgi:hypothetical protein